MLKTLRFLCRNMLVIAALIVVVAFTVVAQDDGQPQVQVSTGTLDVRQNIKYLLPDFTGGQTLYVYLEGVSGNLDPLLALGQGDIPLAEVEAAIDEAIATASESGFDPVVALSETAADLFIAGDDDGGEGYDAALEFVIPEDGTYTLFIGSNYRNNTFGDYRLTIGLNAPVVLTGRASDSGAIIAIKEEATQFTPAVEIVNGVIEDTPIHYTLRDFARGEQLRMNVTATEGELRPAIALQDFSGKLITLTGLDYQSTSVTLEYEFPANAENFQVVVGGGGTNGSYRLTLAANQVNESSLQVDVSAAPIIEQATTVRVGLTLDQISNVDQIAENFDIVATLRLEWHDRARAFSPADCNCTQQSFTGDRFGGFSSQGQWPDFILFNQQGRRDTQNRGAFITSDGSAVFAERFTATLQAPNFDFRNFPFDEQVFFVHVDMVFDESIYTIEEIEGYTQFGAQLGEEEWIVRNEEVIISSIDGRSRFSFKFNATRHLNYYLFRIMLPIAVIVMVSWVTFFLKDFGKRIDVASANLLLFVAFNFTISGELPRLGYLTLLDIVLIATFVVTALIIAFNVYLRRLERFGYQERARRIDRFALWLYPLAYLLIAIYVIVTVT